MNHIERFEVISKIADRALKLETKLAMPKRTKLDWVMDIECADEDIPLDLQGLLDADGSDFTHDIMGIRRHLDRQARKLMDCFCPRYTQKEKTDD